MKSKQFSCAGFLYIAEWLYCSAGLIDAKLFFLGGHFGGMTKDQRVHSTYKHSLNVDTVEPRYNEDLGTMKITLL